MLSLGIIYFRFPIANFQFLCATSHFVFPIGNRQLEIGNDAIRPPLKPYPRPPFCHLREWRTATLSPLQSARSARCPSSRCRRTSPSLLPAAAARPRTPPSPQRTTAPRPPPPPSSKSLRNAPPPAPTVFRVRRIPTTSTASFTFTLPRSTLPVATVPRP